MYSGLGVDSIPLEGDRLLSSPGDRPEELETESEKDRRFPRSGRSQEGERRITAKIWWSLGDGVIRVNPDSGIRPEDWKKKPGRRFGEPDLALELATIRLTHLISIYSVVVVKSGPV